MGGTRLQRLKKAAEKVMDEEDVIRWSPNKINTKSAFKAWGLDIADLESRYKKLQKLGI